MYSCSLLTADVGLLLVQSFFYRSLLSEAIIFEDPMQTGLEANICTVKLVYLVLPILH